MRRHSFPPRAGAASSASLRVVMTCLFLLLAGGAALLRAEDFSSLAEVSAALREHLEFLARDELGGRDSGEPGLEVAAEYIANRFREYGLEPAGDAGTYFQHFTVPSLTVVFTGKSGVRIETAGGLQLEWTAGRDVEALAFAAPGSGSPEAEGTPLVFAGYGISPRDEDRQKGMEYDDYSGIDAQGKVLIILRSTPRGGKEFGGARSPYANLNAKLETARSRGAAGVIFVTPPAIEEEDLRGLALRSAPRGPSLAALIARRESVDQMLRLNGLRLDHLTGAIDRDLRPASREIPGVRVSFSTARQDL
ncbi:MAG: hypothetical protein JXA90_16120, partial [Planctomycetes bacterium]|nr:hypothetical protein [Planctomycetota bacterium]